MRTKIDHCDPDCWACGRQTDPPLATRGCDGCARVVDELDGVQTGADFECGPCFVNRERNEP